MSDRDDECISGLRNGEKDAIEVESGEEKQESSESKASSHNSYIDGHPPQQSEGKRRNRSIWHRSYDIVFWTPPNLRWNADEPPRFSMGLNVLFGFAGAFTVANLYYSHPILNVLAHDFGVPYVRVSNIPTLAQAGYAVGLLFLCPLGDMLQRRPFVLSLVFFTASVSIGLAVTKSLQVFEFIQFLTAVSTVTPQLMLPLVGDLAPPKRRAAALSIVVSGLMLGILLARLLSGIMTQYVSWRYVYWLSVALQYCIFAGLWMFMPDYPATNTHVNYFKMLWSILVMLTKHPVLVQACLISFFTSATFTNFWTVLTFLLSGKPYYFDPVTIGLFALVGIASMICGPIYARVVIDRFVPSFSVLLGMMWCLIGISLGTYTGTFTVAGPIIQAFLGDFGMQTAQIANRSAIYAVEPKGRNRVNTAFMVATFCGQLVGTTVGSHLFARGGWIASGSYSMGSIGMALLVTLARGPWEEAWIGWHGGWSIRKKSRESAHGKMEGRKNDGRKSGTNDPPEQPDGEDVGAENRYVYEAARQSSHEHGDRAPADDAADIQKGLQVWAGENGEVVGRHLSGREELDKTIAHT